MKPTTVLDYSRRLDKVMRYIGDHLDDELDLDHLAAVAAFSPCHFHRIYAGMTGETVAETLRRVWLSRAAGRVIDGDLPAAGGAALA